MFNMSQAQEEFTIHSADLTVTSIKVLRCTAAGPYETYAGSPVSKGVLQHDMWGVQPPSQRWDWDALRSNIGQHGVRNSLLVAPMPTASTSQVSSRAPALFCSLPAQKMLDFPLYLPSLQLLQILGNNECFEPYTSNIYVRRVLSGEFTVVNQHLLSDLVSSGLWSADTKNELVAANGSVQVAFFNLFGPFAAFLEPLDARCKCDAT